jgi:hypothetical protein
VTPEIVSFYRVDPWVRMRRALIFGSTVVTLGALVMGVSFVTHQSEHVRMIAASCGIGTVVVGAVSAVFGMQRVLSDDRCIVVRTDVHGVGFNRLDPSRSGRWCDRRRASRRPRRAPDARGDVPRLDVGDAGGGARRDAAEGFVRHASGLNVC